MKGCTVLEQTYIRHKPRFSNTRNNCTDTISNNISGVVNNICNLMVHYNTCIYITICKHKYKVVYSSTDINTNRGYERNKKESYAYLHHKDNSV